jgi:hypothetical protein
VCGAVSSELPLLLPGSPGPPELFVEVGTQALPPEESGAIRTGRQRFELSLPGEATCDIDLDRARVLVHPATGLDSTALAHLVVDHVLPRVAGERMYCLHAAAVAIEGRAYVLAGESGAGKSTLAVRLARGGAELLGDDCAAILAGQVHPTFRAGRVWSDSYELVGLTTSSTDGKEQLDERHGVTIARWPVPLAGIVLVGAQMRQLGLQEALRLVLGQRFHLGGRSQRMLLDEAVALLNQWGPIHEIDRRVWSPPPEAPHHAGS